MKIDHKKFLFLTGAISAATLAATATVAGCTVNNNTTSAVPDGGALPPEEDPGADDGGATSSKDSGAAKDAAGDSAAACLGNGGMPSCDIESDAGALCVQQCIGYETNFKPAVSADIYACILKLPSCEGDVSPCVTSALSRTCADSTAKPVCDQIFATCTQAGTPATGLTAGNCETLVRGLNTTGRNNFVSCMFEGGCLDPAVCVNAL